MPQQESSASIAAIVLAAGTSSRMGQNKLLLRFGEATLVRHVVTEAIASGTEPVIVVLGYEPERCVAVLNDLEVVFASNPDFALGMTSSLRTGIAAVPPHAEAVIMLLADMPFVTREMIADIAATHLTTGLPLVLSDYAGVQAPPTLFARALFPELLALSDDRRAREVVKRHEAGAAIVHWPAERLRDLDRPEDVIGI